MYSVIEYWSEEGKQRIDSINRIETWDKALDRAKEKMKNLGLNVKDLKEVTEEIGFHVIWKGHIIKIQVV